MTNLALAAELASWGRDHQHPGALALAARIMGGTTCTPNDKVKDPKGSAKGDGEREAVVAIDSYELVDAASERYFIGVRALFQAAGGGDWEDVTLYGELVWTLETCEGQFVYAFREGERGASPRS